MKKSTLIVILLLVLLIALKAYWISTKPMMMDEIGHYELAKWMMENKAFYFGDGEIFPHMALMYVPLFHMIIAGLLYIMPLFYVRMFLGIAVPLITTYFVWKLFYKYDQTGIVAILMNFVPTYFVWTSFSLYSEGIYVMLSVMTIYFFVNRNKLWSLLWLLTLCTKNYISYLIYIPMAYKAYLEKRWKDLGIMTAIAIIMYPVQRYVFSTEHMLSQFGLENINISSPQYLFRYDFSNMWMVVFMSGMIFFYLFIPALIKKHKFEILWGLLPLIFFIIGVCDTRRWIITAPLVFMFPVMAFSENNYLSDIEKKIVKSIYIICMLSIFLFLIAGQFTTTKLSEPLVDSFEYLKTLPDNVSILTSFAYETYYYTGKPVIAFNTNVTYNNATHIYVVDAWVKGKFWYDNFYPPVETLEGNGWKRTWEAKDNSSYILERCDQ